MQFDENNILNSDKNHRHKNFYFFKILFVYCFTAQVLKVCRTPGPTTCSRTKMLQLVKVCLKS